MYDQRTTSFSWLSVGPFGFYSMTQVSSAEVSSDEYCVLVVSSVHAEMDA